ncbi:CAP domain-containing protein, partial [Streptomyces sp. MBT51]|uniref:CAP domain-containing protein n=1 Tax=Streptomyces sp. MBT51 TaxID=2800408 RepID=UPI001F2EDAB2
QDSITAAGELCPFAMFSPYVLQRYPAAVMESWMNSPGHRANILNCSFKEIGVGRQDSSGGPVWTQNFGAAL